MLRFSVFCWLRATLTGINIAAGISAAADTRSRSVGVLSCICATVCRAATIGATSLTRCAAAAGRSADTAAGLI
jgi:hypothetical protein